jgi:uncharacterized Zn finger protein
VSFRNSRKGPGWWAEAEPRRPGTGPKRAAGRKPFGRTWWGTAWVDALEHRALLDPNRLPRGRTYARSGQVGEVTIDTGAVLAQVQGSRAQPYSARIDVRRFTSDEWDRVLDALCKQVGHTAALLEGEFPPGVAGDLRAIGLDLLPGPGELEPRCSCPDSALLCKHAAAVCYLIADSLDDDPFVLFMLRGRDRPEVLSGLRSRRTEVLPDMSMSPDDETGWTIDAGVPAGAAWARTPEPIPPIPPPPRKAGRPPIVDVEPPEGCDLQGETLGILASDAVNRAMALATGDRCSGLELSLDEDVARRTAALLDTAGSTPVNATGLAELERRTGLAPRELRRRALAFRDGGTSGFDVLMGSWDPDPGALAPGRRHLGPSAVARRNRLTRGEGQLRLGRDGRWYPYRRTRNGWDPDGPPFETNELTDHIVDE